jgi:arginase
MAMARRIGLIGAPTSAGAYAPGQEKAPAAFRRHGLLAALTKAGSRVDDLGDIAGFRWRPDPQQQKAMNLNAVRHAAAALADKVAEALQGEGAAIVLGGDCTVELGTVAGALRDGESVGLVYVDLDADLNVPATSDGALDWTGVAHLLDLPGAAPELSGIGPRRPMLAPADILFLGAEEITEAEAATMRALDLRRIRLAEIETGPVAAARRAVDWGGRFDRLLIHLDVDVLNFADFPIAENTRRHGLGFAALAALLRPLTTAPNWRALTVTEVNPDHAPDEGETFGLLIAMIASAMAR